MNETGEQKDDKSMIELDNQAKILLNEIKSILLKKKSTEPKLTQKTSYRAITKMAIEELHTRLINNG